MNIEEMFCEEIKAIKVRLPDKSKKVIVDDIENSINIYRSLRRDMSLETFSDYEKNWIKRCAVELLERGVERINLSSYSENGYQESYFSDLISDSLRYEILPLARGIIRESNQEKD